MLAGIAIVWTLSGPAGADATVPLPPAAVPARDDDRLEAEKHARTAENLVARGDYDAAERELHAAYTLDSSPYHLFGLGTLAKLRGNCDRAIGFFERTIQSLPTSELDPEARASTKASAEQQIRACGGEPPEDEIIPPPRLPERVREVDAPAIDRPARPRPWHRDPAAAVLLAFGSASVALGGGLIAGGVILDRRSTRADSASGFVAARDRAESLVIGGAIATGVGTSLVIGAIARYAVMKRRSVTRKAQASRNPPAARTHWRRH